MEKLFFNDDIDFVRAYFTKSGSAVVFRGNIFHKVTQVSWETEYGFSKTLQHFSLTKRNDTFT